MSKDELPIHIGIIMDGNGRWATKQGLPRSAGHKKGANALTNITRYANKIGIKHMTVFAFSTENFSRPKEEVNEILGLMRAYLKKQKKSKKENVRLRFIGDISVLPDDIQQGIAQLEDLTKSFTGLSFNIAFNYGGRQDILKAAKSLAVKYKDDHEMSLDAVNEADFQQLLYTKDQPELDMLIRTSGELRISNFLLWQAAYAEFVFVPTLWPDFDSKELDNAIEEYKNRNRRRGGL